MRAEEHTYQLLPTFGAIPNSAYTTTNENNDELEENEEIVSSVS